MSSEPQQIFVRNTQGRLWGPLTLQTLELLLQNRLIEGQIQVSRDGVNFALPERFPDIREHVPRALWGGPQASPPPAAPAQAPLAGPGAVAAAKGAAPTPGPGALPRPPPTLRPGPGAAPRPPGPTPPSPAPTAPQPPAPPRPQQQSAPVGFGPDGSLSGPPPFGELAVVSPFRLYYLAASTDQTGLLSFRLSDRTIEVHFRKGNPEHVGSNHPDDALAGFLLRERLATPEQLAKTELSLDQFGGDLVAALFGTGVLNPGNAFTHLAQRAQSLLMKALLAESGTFEWRVQDLPPHKAMPLGNRWSVLMEIVRRVPVVEIRRRLGDVLDNPVMKSGGAVALAELRLTPHETRAMGFIDGVRSLSLLARDLPQDGDLFLRLAWALRDLDIVSFASTRLAPPPPPPPPPQVAPAPPQVAPPPKQVAPPPKQAAAPPAPRPPPAVAPAPAPRAAPKPAPAAPAPVDHQAELVVLRALAAKVQTQNHFETLGLKESADSAQVKLAYFKLAKLYHPDTVAQDAPAEIGKLKADIFGAVGEAYRTLADDASRAKYLEELRTGAGDVDVLAILQAEELFQKGCLLVKAKRFPEAVELLTDAIATNAEEGEFYAWRGIARFFSTSDREQGQREAARDFEVAVKKNPRCAQAFYFQGQMARLTGEGKKALEFFKKTLDLQPDHLDAQREIRYLKK